MPAGRPTKYRPEYCDKAVEFLSEGFSCLGLAGELSVTESTIYNWMDQHPEFLEAIKKGQAKSGLWWERTLKTNAKTGEGNATACIFGVKNRSRSQWRDRQEIDHRTDGVLEIVWAGSDEG